MKKIIYRFMNLSYKNSIQKINFQILIKILKQKFNSLFSIKDKYSNKKNIQKILNGEGLNYKYEY